MGTRRPAAEGNQPAVKDYSPDSGKTKDHHRPAPPQGPAYKLTTDSTALSRQFLPRRGCAVQYRKTGRCSALLCFVLTNVSCCSLENNPKATFIRKWIGEKRHMENRLELGEVAGRLHTGRTCLPQHINIGLDMPFGGWLSQLQQNEAEQMLAEKPSGKRCRVGLALWMFFCQLLFPISSRPKGRHRGSGETHRRRIGCSRELADISPTSPRTVLIKFVMR